MSFKILLYNLKKFYFEKIVGSHIEEIIGLLYLSPISFNDNLYSTEHNQKIGIGTVHQPYLDFTSFACTNCVCVFPP